ncbi:MAG: type IV-A pilus assembly ATPase PilB [Planctomycetes bacterium]|nr:type IV-A pilus assembly ATPase PilB [Planctomycetota bacterium]
MARFDRKLQSIVAKRQLVPQAQLEKTFRQAEEEQKSLCEMLLERNLVEERVLVGCIAEEMNIPPVDLDRVRPTEEALDTLPQDSARYYGVLPLSRVGSVLTVALANPFDVLKLDDVELVTKCDIRPVVSTDVAISRAIERHYNPSEEAMSELFGNLDEPEMELTKEVEEDADLSQLTRSAEQAPVVRLVNLIIYQAIRDGASDIHIEPFEKQLRVRYRVDGLLQETTSPPKRLQNAVVSRIKIMSELDIAEKHKPQDGKFQLKVAGRPIDFRVSSLPTLHGEKVVLRILDSSKLAMSLDNLGFEQKALDDFRNAIHSPYGMILVTGPTGSGKSTTLYSAIKEIMRPEDNIVTIEDPVEYQLDGINQVQVNPLRGVTFSGALRSILRQDPDTILVGEIRDGETADIAIKAALTGHLVLSTLHTNDAPSTITRMTDMGVDAFLVASSVNVVSAQRLCRRLCGECKEQVKVPRARMLEMGFREDELEKATIHKPVGCLRCNQVGYRGRFALLETVPITNEVKQAVIQGKSAVDIKQLALEQGMISLRRCGLLNAMRGNTSLEEVHNVTMADE